jgi:hypothetical protein
MASKFGHQNKELFLTQSPSAIPWRTCLEFHEFAWLSLLGRLVRSFYRRTKSGFNSEGARDLRLQAGVRILSPILDCGEEGKSVIDLKIFVKGISPVLLATTARAEWRNGEINCGVTIQVGKITAGGTSDSSCKSLIRTWEELIEAMGRNYCAAVGFRHGTFDQSQNS